MITINIKQYFELCKAAAELEALESAGVDNWGGYDMRWEHEEFSELSDMTLEEFAESIV